jgi:hypothetical protein
MTADKFRNLALEISGASESLHMSHPDFRVGGKIFATLGYPDDEHGMVRLTPEQQRTFRHKAPSVFEPCAGAWGKRGKTRNANQAPELNKGVGVLLHITTLSADFAGMLPQFLQKAQQCQPFAF